MIDHNLEPFSNAPSQLPLMQLHSVSSCLLSVGRATGLTAATGLSTSLKQAHGILHVPPSEKYGLEIPGRYGSHTVIEAQTVGCALLIGRNVPLLFV